MGKKNFHKLLIRQNKRHAASDSPKIRTNARISRTHCTAVAGSKCQGNRQHAPMLRSRSSSSSSFPPPIKWCGFINHAHSVVYLSSLLFSTVILKQPRRAREVWASFLSPEACPSPSTLQHPWPDATPGVQDSLHLPRRGVCRL